MLNSQSVEWSVKSVHTELDPVGSKRDSLFGVGDRPQINLANPYKNHLTKWASYGACLILLMLVALRSIDIYSSSPAITLTDDTVNSWISPNFNRSAPQAKCLRITAPYVYWFKLGLICPRGFQVKRRDPSCMREEPAAGHVSYWSSPISTVIICFSLAMFTWAHYCSSSSAFPILIKRICGRNPDMLASQLMQKRRGCCRFSCFSIPGLYAVNAIIIRTTPVTASRVALWCCCFALTFTLVQIYKTHHDMQRRRSVQLFLANAVKQKFSIVGVAVETALRDLEGKAGPRSHRKTRFQMHLQQALDDCRHGETRCVTLQQQCGAKVSTTKVLPSMSAEIPMGLRMAILDDSLLVRKNLRRIFHVDFKAHPISFAKGATALESLRFAHDIVAANVDIAILDENLEYADVHLSGAAVARQARKLGFKGCLIRHSAQFAVFEELKEDFDAFDGVVNKTASRQDLLRGIAQIWRSSLKKKRRHTFRVLDYQPSGL